MATSAPSALQIAVSPAPERTVPRILHTSRHSVEVVSDPGEGAQKCGQIFATVSA